MKTLELVERYLSKESLKEDHLVIFRSPNGETDWTPLKPEDHPEWIKHPAVLGTMLNSNNSLAHPDDPGWFYTAFKASDAAAFMAAEARSNAEPAPEGSEGSNAPAIQQRAPRLLGPDGKLLH